MRDKLAYEWGIPLAISLLAVGARYCINADRAINNQFTQSQNLNVTRCSGEGGVSPLYIVGVTVHSSKWKSYTSSNIIGPSSNQWGAKSRPAV